MGNNILTAIINIANFGNYSLIDYLTKSEIRINAVGEQLEYFIKDALADALQLKGINAKETQHSKVFSWLGNQNYPPDLMINGGDAFEVKKIQTLRAKLALNNSYPKDKLYSDGERIIDSCRECEDNPWSEKDIFYVVGYVPKSKLRHIKHLYIVHGQCYAANREIYQNMQKLLKKEITSILKINDLDFQKTKELGRIANVDPLGITFFRMRGMWEIQNPVVVFQNVYRPSSDESFSLAALILTEKYHSYPAKDITSLENHEKISVGDIKIKDPNNPAKRLDAKLITIPKEEQLYSDKKKAGIKVTSLFSGCGGLDLGFTNAGFSIVFANDNDLDITETYEKNHNMRIDIRPIEEIPSNDILDSIGIIGGPPCQSWSLAGMMRGVKDKRGQLFYEYIRILRDKKPLFFVAENVPGIISKTHLPEFKKIISNFESYGYQVNYKLLDAKDYGVPQDRKRVFIVGYRKDLGIRFHFPIATHSEQTNQLFGEKLKKWLTLKDAIGDLPEAKSAKEKNHANDNLEIPNHEYMIGEFSSHYMSRNRRRDWAEPSFTIQAGGRHAPLHPNSSEMRIVAKDKCEFVGEKPFFRRLSVRECARIQTFPDDFIFHYKNVADGYKMVGNAVPVKLAEVIAVAILNDLKKNDLI